MGLTTADSGNILVQNYGRNPAVNFNFMLRVEGLYDLPCRAVRVFQRENEYELIQEGGLNDYVHMRRKPISKPFTFQVERYVGTDVLDPLANGTDLILPIFLYISRYGIYNGEFLPVRTYTFTGCTVMAKEYGELNAEKSGLLVETTTIAYREMACLENVAASFLESDTWKFKGTEKKGDESTPRRARHTNTTIETALKLFGLSLPLKLSVSDENPVLKYMKTNAEQHMWMFDGDMKKGNKVQCARNLTTTYPNGKTDVIVDDKDNLLPYATRKAESNMWQFKDTDKAGNGPRNAARPSTDENWGLKKAAEAAEANRWPPKRNAVDIVKFLEKKST